MEGGGSVKTIRERQKIIVKELKAKGYFIKVRRGPGGGPEKKKKPYVTKNLEKKGGDMKKWGREVFFKGERKRKKPELKGKIILCK